MFTGIVGDVAEVERVDSGQAGSRIRISTPLANELSVGESIAVNGVCLTATAVDDGAFEAEAMNETLSVTSLGPLSAGDRVNLELPLRPSDRLGGHVVQGHVDGTGEVVDIQQDGFALRLWISAGPDVLRYVAPRGSIALDGVSLTVSSLNAGGFEVSLIPETQDRTTLGGLAPGSVVNVECDVLAKYVERVSTFEEDDSSDER